DAPAPPAARGRTDVIPNGVRLPAEPRTRFGVGRGPRVVASGRLAPSKFLREILEAMVLVRRRLPGAELHVIGSAEPRHADYARDVVRAAGAELGRAVLFPGPDPRAPERLAAFVAAAGVGEEEGWALAGRRAVAARVPPVVSGGRGP